MAIDPSNTTNWYVNNQAGVSIYLCSQSAECTPADFGTSPVVSDADVGGDGVRDGHAGAVHGGSAGPDAVAGWNLPGVARAGRRRRLDRQQCHQPHSRQRATNGSCSGDALIRSMAAMRTPGGGERVYLGMYGSAEAAGTWPAMC